MDAIDSADILIMKKIFIVSFLINCMFSAASAQTDKIDNYIKSAMSKRHIPGLSLAVVRNDSLLKQKATA